MDRLLKNVLIIFYFLVLCAPLVFAQESITITTYYPSPYGSYNALQTSRLGVGDNNADGNLTSADVPTTNGDAWFRGNVGIGTITPSAKLQINSSGNVDTLNISSSTNTHYTQIIQNNGGGGLGLLVRTGSAAGAGASFKVATSDEATTRLWVGNNGFVGIGTAVPHSKFSVMQTINGLTTGLQFSGHHTPGVAAGGIINAFDSDGTTARHLTLQLNAGNVGIGNLIPAFKLTVNGSAWCLAGAWTGSDLRWKKDITTLDNPLARLLRLRGVKYDWRREEFKENNFPEGRQIGMIAQEVEKEFPELIIEDKEGYKAIAYDRFTAVLLEALKAQQEEIEGLKEELSSIRSMLNK
ncbi:MAG: tail fiber domain-containing protein [Candidatus Omnitrophota bacterium]